MMSLVGILLNKLVNLVGFFIHIVKAYLEAFYRIFVPKPMRSLTGEIILITGSAQGLGKEICKVLVQSSSKVTLVLWDWDKERNENTAKELQMMSCPGTRIFTYTLDISKREEVESNATKVKGEIGDVTIIINNAGIAPIQPFLEIHPQQLEKTFNVNVLGQFWILREFLPRMIENHHGHIATISSMGALMQIGGSVPYYGTKAAIHAYIESLKMELVYLNTHGIRFTTIYPYFMHTDMVKDLKITEDYNRFRLLKILPFIRAEDVSVKVIQGIRRNYEYVYCPSYLPYVLQLLVFLPLGLKRELLIFLASQLEHPNIPRIQKSI